mmetsp:Transcript_27454/g.72892  ORF Transcript_27454/g.72892 Transcript_27454/m.72892 type:complete len:242 (-) Transcript_27454:43-768(-)
MVGVRGAGFVGGMDASGTVELGSARHNVQHHRCDVHVLDWDVQCTLHLGWKPLGCGAQRGPPSVVARGICFQRRDLLGRCSGLRSRKGGFGTGVHGGRVGACLDSSEFRGRGVERAIVRPADDLLRRTSRGKHAEAGHLRKLRRLLVGGHPGRWNLGLLLALANASHRRLARQCACIGDRGRLGVDRSLRPHRLAGRAQGGRPWHRVVGGGPLCRRQRCQQTRTLGCRCPRVGCRNMHSQR